MNVSLTIEEYIDAKMHEGCYGSHGITYRATWTVFCLEFGM